jgi:hypothetical protein
VDGKVTFAGNVRLGGVAGVLFGTGFAEVRVRERRERKAK